MKQFLIFIITLFAFQSCKKDQTPLPLFQKTGDSTKTVEKATIAPRIDGNPDDPAWNKTEWIPLSSNWQGDTQNLDIQYKVAWTPDALYLLVALNNIEINSSVGNPLENFENQDRLLIYLDENNSGGNYANDHSAFAYQVLPDGFSIDFNSEGKPTSYSHISNRMMREGKKTFWELKLTVFNETYCDNQPNEAVKLAAGIKLGFALAFLQVNTEETPDLIIGSIQIPQNYEGRINTDSGLFGTLFLTE